MHWRLSSGSRRGFPWFFEVVRPCKKAARERLRGLVHRSSLRDGKCRRVRTHLRIEGMVFRTPDRVNCTACIAIAVGNR